MWFLFLYYITSVIIKKYHISKVDKSDQKRTLQLLMTEKKYISNLHKSTKRNYIERMINDKVNCMIEAKKYDYNYWDGDRKFGYGGYKYIPDRWKGVAENLISDYKLNNSSKLWDVGCGKGFLLYEIKKLLPSIEVLGIDISNYGLKNSKSEISKFLRIGKAQEKFNFDDKYFDLVISLGALHNLKLSELKLSLKEITRVGKNHYVMVESFTNEEELFNLQCWALTCETFLSTDQWIWLFKEFGYTGDYEFIFFN